LKKNLTVSIAIFMKEITDLGFKVWTQVRLEEGSLYGKLEFPGGKIEPLETPEEACRREVHEEVGVLLGPEEKLHLFKYQDYTFGQKNICLFVFISKFDQLPKEKGDWLEITYDKKSAYLEGKIPPINHVILDDLAVYIQTQYKAGATKYLWR
jgi:8-oxo-dGTP diphosphatase